MRIALYSGNPGGGPACFAFLEAAGKFESRLGWERSAGEGVGWSAGSAIGIPELFHARE